MSSIARGTGLSKAVLGTGRCRKHLQSGCQHKQEGTDSQFGYSDIDKENNECLHGEILLDDNSV